MSNKMCLHDVYTCACIRACSGVASYGALGHRLPSSFGKNQLNQSSNQSINQYSFNGKYFQLTLAQLELRKFD